MKNNTFDKAKETKKKSNKKWYIINGKKYSYYIWALPLLPFVVLHDALEERADKRRDRKWARKWEYDLRDFIKDGYENENYSKSVEKDYYDTWVKFEERA